MTKLVDFQIAEALKIPAVPTSARPDFGFPCVAKPYNGSLGIGVEIVSAPTKELRIYQPYVEGSDVCAAVIGGKAVAAISRIPKVGEFRANVAQGANATPHELMPAERAIAERVALALGAMTCCVDMIVQADGSPLFLECNRNSEMRVTADATGIDAVAMRKEFIEKQLATETYGDYIIKRPNKKEARDAMVDVPRDAVLARQRGPHYVCDRLVLQGAVAIINGEIAGYATPQPAYVYVNEKHRGRGVGARLIRKLWCPAASVRKDNESSLNMLGSLGYRALFDDGNRKIMVKEAIRC